MVETHRRSRQSPRDKADLLIVNANELITLTGSSQRPLSGKEMRELGIIRDGGLAIKNGRIIAVGKSGDVRKQVKADNVIGADGKTVLPGFVDPHAHLVFAGSSEDEFQMRLQGAYYLEILGAGGGILKTMRDTRKASVEKLVELATDRLDNMLEYGTTTLEAKSGYGLDAKNELKILEVIKRLNQMHTIDLVPTFLGAHAIPPEFKESSRDYVRLVIEEMLPKTVEKKLAEFCDVFCEKGFFSLEQTRRILTSAKECGLRSKVHADVMTPFGSAELAADVGAISADHLVFSSDESLRAMASRNVIAVLLPAAAFSMMNGKFPDGRKMIDFGIPLALGSDFNPNCWVENMQLVIGFACHFMRLTPSEAIVASTINAAHAIGRAKEIGSLEVGKKADVLLLGAPNHNNLGYRFGSNLVDKVIKNGRVVIDFEERRGGMTYIERSE